jgi:hypothetical protein
MPQSPGIGRESGHGWRARVAATAITSPERCEEEGGGAGAGAGAAGGEGAAGAGAGTAGGGGGASAGAAGPAEEAMAQHHATTHEQRIAQPW